MAESDLRKFFFYQKYIWNPEDFENMETWMYGSIEGLAEGAHGGAVLSGLRVLPSSGLTVNIDPGIACSPLGRIVVQAAAAQATLGSPAGNPARSLVVLRPKLTEATDIPEPLNPSNMVPLHEKLEHDIVVINGTPAASPVYPATQSGDIVLMGFRLNASHSTIVRADLDLGVVSRRRKRVHKINKVSQSYSVTGTDEIIEADFSSASGVLQLPAAGDSEGTVVHMVKTDSSSNVVAVSGNGAEEISGQNRIDLDSQWQSVTVYCDGLAWRQL